MRYFFVCFLLIASLGAAELRIVSLAPALTELICHLGKGASLVGRSDVCNYPAEVKKLPVAGRFAMPFVEKVLALKPHIIVTSDFVNPGVKVNFERAGIRVLQLPCRDLEEYRKCVAALGETLQCGSAAAREIARIDAVKKRKIKKSGIRVLWVIWDSPLMTPGKFSHLHTLLELAGAENATGTFKREYLRPSFDLLFKNEPHFIIWSASGAGWKQRRIWQKFSAVRQGHIMADFDQDKFLRPGPRMFEAVDELRKIFEKWKRP